MGVANYRGEETYYINTVTVSEMPEKKEADAGDESCKVLNVYRESVDT